MEKTNAKKTARLILRPTKDAWIFGPAKGWIFTISAIAIFLTAFLILPQATQATECTSWYCNPPNPQPIVPVCGGWYCQPPKPSPAPSGCDGWYCQPANPQPLQTQTTPRVLGATALPNLYITKTADKTFANPGAIVNYHIEVSNRGDAIAQNVSVADDLPPGFNPTSNETQQWNIGNLNPGQNWSKDIAIKISSDETAGAYQNVATAKADNNKQVRAGVNIEVRTGQVLGTSILPDTGGNFSNIIILLLTSIIGGGGGLYIFRRYHKPHPNNFFKKRWTKRVNNQIQ